MLVTVATEIPRLLACNGSRLLGGHKPPSNDDPTARNEGIAAHWAIGEHLDGRDPTGTKAPNGVIITQSIAATIADFVAHVIDKPRAQADFEQELQWHSENFIVNCRPDFWGFDDYTLEIDDFKHGFRVVEPERNFTLLTYAAAVVRELSVRPAFVVMRIHQPRVPHPVGTVREWRLTWDEFVSWQNWLSHSLSNLSDTLNSGAHCYGCANVTTCPAMRTTAFNALDVSLTAHSENMPDDVIGPEIDLLTEAEKRIKTRKKQLEDLAAYRLRQGAIIKNYALERAQSNRAWIEGFTPDFLSSILGVDCKVKESITPKQAENAGADKAIVGKFTVRKETGLKLTRVNADEIGKRLFNSHKR